MPPEAREEGAETVLEREQETQQQESRHAEGVAPVIMGVVEGGGVVGDGEQARGRGGT